MMVSHKELDRPYILDIDIAGESLVLGINNIKDSIAVFEILEKNGYNLTMSAVKHKQGENDEQVQISSKRAQ